MPNMSTEMIWQTTTTSSADTERLGELLGSQLTGGEVIEMRSDLGGGKTTFVIGLVQGAGSGDRVSSPTFTLSRLYKAKNFDILHYDFYRLSEAGILTDQLAEALNNKNVVLVEWAGIVENVLPDERITIKFQTVVQSPDERQISIHYPENSSRLISYLKTSFSELEP